MDPFYVGKPYVHSSNFAIVNTSKNFLYLTDLFQTYGTLVHEIK